MDCRVPARGVGDDILLLSRKKREEKKSTRERGKKDGKGLFTLDSLQESVHHGEGSANAERRGF